MKASRLAAAAISAGIAVASARASTEIAVVPVSKTGALVAAEVVVTLPNGRNRAYSVPIGSALVLDGSNAHLARTSRLGREVSRFDAQAVMGGQQYKPPTKVIHILVVAKMHPPHQAPSTSSGVTRTRSQITKFGSTTGGGLKSLTKGEAGVVMDSSGQEHIRGEHTDITYVIDGIPLPDTLSGREGSVVVPSTIQSIQVITGGFAPEFGGQTAGVLNIATIPRAQKNRIDTVIQGGSFNTLNGEITAQGPLGQKAGYVVDLNGTKTDLAAEPQQPYDSTAHNAGSSRGTFLKFTSLPNSKDKWTLTTSQQLDAMQINNRAGLPSSFAAYGEGYGFLGLRNSNGIRPDANAGNAGLLGAAPMLLPSQQADGMNINQDEASEFATLAYTHSFKPTETLELAATFLHSGQNVTNGNPSVNVQNLPVDNSIEFNPSAYRNVHHVQLVGSYETRVGAHDFKTGFLLDGQSGNESYQVIPTSQLALDALAANAPILAPQGTVGSQVDIDGYHVYTPTSSVSPTMDVQRQGVYQAAYGQDTWSLTKKLTLNYGVRWDEYRQNQNLGEPSVTDVQISPRVNFEYRSDAKTTYRWSFDRLLNIPPLAQGAVIGLPLQAETLSQYDASVVRTLSPGQTLEVAYYYKDIRDQVDVGLLLPGSEVGLYTGVNFQYGAVHGLEVTYNVSALKPYGWDSYLTYTLSAAMPSGVDNTGAPAPDFNDHDERTTVGAGLAYTWKNGFESSATFDYGSGLASSTLTATSPRTPNSEVGLHFTTGQAWFKGRAGLSLDVANLFDNRAIINFQSGFSGTRFQEGRRIDISAFFKF